MRNLTLLVSCVLLVFTSCGPRVISNITSDYSPLDYREEVRLLGLQDPAPAQSKIIGSIKIGDTGFSTNCGYDVVIDKAKIEARKAGANAIKIVEHTPPSMWGSSCHRITAQMLLVDCFDTVPAITANIVTNEGVEDTTDKDYALLHIYRSNPIGSMVGYNLYLGDSIICRVTNKWRRTLKIKKDGLNTLWAKTESKREVPVNIKFGQEYYLRCSVVMGAFVGRPKLELVDSTTGRTEFQTVQMRESKKRDYITLKDGREVECRILNEDDERVYVTLFTEGKKYESSITKDSIQEIIKCE